MDRVIIRKASDSIQKLESDYPGDTNEVLEKKKKGKVRKRQPFSISRENVENTVNNIDNHDIEDYHDYERKFDNEPMMG
jgi:hypothetical protein